MKNTPCINFHTILIKINLIVEAKTVYINGSNCLTNQKYCFSNTEALKPPSNKKLVTFYGWLSLPVYLERSWRNIAIIVSTLSNCIGDRVKITVGAWLRMLHHMWGRQSDVPVDFALLLCMEYRLGDFDNVCGWWSSK